MDKTFKTEPEEISLKEVALKLMLAINYLKSKWILILSLGILGSIIGVGYAIIEKPIYTATSTFVLDEGNKSGGLGQYAGIASMAGIDIGGSGEASGIFQGDNIIELYKSRAMIEKTLLSPIIIKGKKQLLIERYVSFNNLDEKWKHKDHIGTISFYGDPEKFNRTQDSIITNVVDDFNKRILNVEKPDKKLSIFKVDIATKDEIFSKEFNTKLVETVNNFYTYTKTKKSSQNLQVLQKQADSVKRVLNYSLGGVASAMDAAPNANPGLLVLRVPSQRKQVDVQASTAIYGEIVKNLELSKISLRQETPLIQVVDKPYYPLEVKKFGIIKGFFLGGFIFVFLTITFCLLKNLFKSSMPK